MTLPKSLLWLDLETTGLDPYRDSVLEVGVFQVPFETPFDLSTEPDYHAVLSFNQWDGKISRAVREMHVKSGLVGECVLSEMPRDSVNEYLCEKFPPIIAVDGTPIPYVLAGSSVHFDLVFIRRHFPTFARSLSHRVYDVSSLRLFCYSLGMPEMSKSDPKHRVLSDIRASVALGRHCESWLRTRQFRDRMWSGGPCSICGATDCGHIPTKMVDR